MKTSSLPFAVRRLPFLFALLFAACDTPTMSVADPAYTPTSTVPFIYHWRAGHSIAFYVDRTDEPSDVDLGKAVNDAIKAWSPIARLGEIQMHVVKNLHDADVVVHFYRSPRLVEPDPDACPVFDVGVGNRTYLCIASDSQPVTLPFVDGSNGHVTMDLSVSPAVLDTIAFFPALVAHEMGHVLGIGAHSPNAGDLMFGHPRVFAPTASDAATLRYILMRRPDVLF